MKANEPKFGRQLWLFVMAAAVLTICLLLFSYARVLAQSDDQDLQARDMPHVMEQRSQGDFGGIK